MYRIIASVAVVIAVLTVSSRAAMAQDSKPLPSPLSFADVIRIAGERRDEIQAARARTTGGEARPTIAVAGVAAETGIVRVVYLDEAFERYLREGRFRVIVDSRSASSG